MSKTRVVLRIAGFREIRTSPGAVALVRAAAEGVAARAGNGFEMLPMQSPRNRAHAIVAPVTYEAARRNARDNTLIRALGAGG